MRRFAQAHLYVVTSQPLSSGRSTLDIIRQALRGGASLFQLREKELTMREFMALGREVRKMTADAGALLIVNDRLDAAMALDADGVHLGQSDLPVDVARRLAPDLIVGASSHNVKEAVAAQELGASYVNIGPIFPTKTKEWSDEFLGLQGLDRIAARVTIPFTVMGGIKTKHIADLVAHGARTIALVTAVTKAPYPAAACRNLLAAIKATY